jgi:hypothetical protein
LQAGYADVTPIAFLILVIGNRPLPPHPSSFGSNRFCPLRK